MTKTFDDFYHVSAYAITNIGKVRKNNEDNFFLDDGQYLSLQTQKTFGQEQGQRRAVSCEYKEENGNQFIFAVSDGIGGRKAGEVASFLIVDQLNKMRSYLFQDSIEENVIGRFQEIVNKTNSLIYLDGIASEEKKGMGATLTGFIINGGGLYSFNVGDSRTYLFINGALKQITSDHTEDPQLLDYGLKRVEDAERAISKKVLNRYFGVNQSSLDLNAEIGNRITINEKAWALCCSDGLTDILSKEQIEAAMKKGFFHDNLKGTLHSLVEMACEGDSDNSGGTDNITGIIVEIRQLPDGENHGEGRKNRESGKAY